MMSRLSALLLRVTYIAVLLTVPGIARAQDDATVEIARQRFREGVTFYDQRQYEKARLAFLQAYALKAHPAVLLNLAQSELRAGRPEDAAGHFAEYLRVSKDASEGDRQEAQLGLDASRSKVGEVTVAVDATGAQILIDGAQRGVSPLQGPLYVPVGNHAIEARANDRKVTKTVNIGAGQSTTVTLSLRSSTAAAAPVPPSKAAAEEDEEGEEDEALPPTPGIPPEDSSSSAEGSTGGRRNFFEWLVDTPLALVGAGVGVVSLGVGIGFAAAATGDYNNADSLKQQINSEWVEARKLHPVELAEVRPCSIGDNVAQLVPNSAAFAKACAAWKDAADAGDSKKPIAIVGSVVGGVFIAGTVVYYFVDPGAKASAEARTREGPRVGFFPVFGADRAGIGLTGRF